MAHYSMILRWTQINADLSDRARRFLAATVIALATGWDDADQMREPGGQP
jgi:hypothetical protein